MDLGGFLIKRIVIPFFVITACVSIVMGILGRIFYSDMYLPYTALFLPALYGATTVLPSLVFYSKKELSVKQIKLRRIIQVLLIEALVLLINYWNGNIKSAALAVSLAVAVLIIILTVYAIQYLNEKRTADELNAALKRIKKENSPVQKQ